MRIDKKHKKVSPKNRLYLVICEKVTNFAFRKLKIIKTINKIR